MMDSQSQPVTAQTSLANAGSEPSGPNCPHCNKDGYCSNGCWIEATPRAALEWAQKYGLSDLIEATSALRDAADLVVEVVQLRVELIDRIIAAVLSGPGLADADTSGETDQSREAT